MSAPLIGMSFLSFLILLILSAIAAAVLHWVFRYRLCSGIDGFLGQWIGSLARRMARPCRAGPLV